MKLALECKHTCIIGADSHYNTTVRLFQKLNCMKKLNCINILGYFYLLIIIKYVNNFNYLREQNIFIANLF